MIYLFIYSSIYSHIYLFIIDLFVKGGYYTAKIGELEKWLTKISYSGDGKLYE